METPFENQETGIEQSEPSYLDLAKQGHGSVWRYILGVFTILFIWLILGGFATAILLIGFGIFQGVPINNLIELVLDPSLLGYIPYYLVVNVGFLFFLFGIWLSVRLIHGRPLRSLVTWRRSIRWKRVGVGFMVWALLLGIGTLVEYLVSPTSFTVTFNASIFIPFVLLAILITPLQTTAEELFFRGYLVQAGSLISRNWIFLSIWSGVLFAMPHFINPEVASNTWAMMMAYFVLGAFLAWISLKDGTIELAIGVHAANNLMAGLLVTFPESVLPTPAILTTTQFDPVYSLVTVIFFCALFYLLIFVRRKSTKRLVETGASLD